jgi:cell wall-associated NlpC family hydrolase
MSSLMRTTCFVVGLALLSASAWAQELPAGSLHAPTVQMQSGPDSLPPAPSWDQRLKRVANDFLGTRYRLGGSSQDTGLDCSGLIKQIWQRLGLSDLPHQAAKMAKLGVPVQLRDIQVGDLVFFNTTGKQNSHVGVYIGDGRFVHASSVLKKVTENSLSERYYQKTFNGIRRVAGLDSANDASAISE